MGQSVSQSVHVNALATSPDKTEHMPSHLFIAIVFGGDDEKWHYYDYVSLSGQTALQCPPQQM